jgi:cell wall-associated NlpC family hydrolase
VAIPRVSAAQWHAGPHVGMDDLEAGDLVFFATSLADPATIHHVDMYIGRGLMVEAPFTGASVRISSIGRADYIGAVRPTGWRIRRAGRNCAHRLLDFQGQRPEGSGVPPLST